MGFFERFLNKILLSSLSLLGRLCPERGRIYMLHHISNSENKFNISPDRLCEVLKKLSDRVIKIDDIDTHDKFIIFTIDDVPEDFYQNGFPLFVKYNVPFTIFINISLLDQKGYLNTSQLKELSASPLCTVGSHGLSHEYYKHKSKSEALMEFRDSKDHLESILGRRIDFFAFPFGSFYACGYKNKKYLMKYYKAGFSTIPTHISKFEIIPKYFLPRLNLTNRTKI